MVEHQLSLYVASSQGDSQSTEYVPRVLGENMVPTLAWWCSETAQSHLANPTLHVFYLNIDPAC